MNLLSALFVLALALAVVVVLLLLWAAGVYNSLVRLRNQIENAWAQIDVQLKRRHDLIPNLVETVRGYAKHEQGTFEKVTQARNVAMNASGLKERAEAENMLSSTLKTLFAVSEAYPELKANQNFLQLQEEVASTENKIAFARQFYNDSVMRYNTKVESIPTNIIAGMFNFERMEFFEVENAAEREPVKVQF
ncbi:MAG: LemA family protein [Verrucomicrobiae bacterium]|nr:LemA family protein [Verrucomicrobiae bacterium]